MAYEIVILMYDGKKQQISKTKTEKALFWDGARWIAISNDNGDGFTEEFLDPINAVKYLEGEIEV